MRRVWLLGIAVVACAALLGFAAGEPRRAPAVPMDSTLLAVVPGLERARYVVGHEPDMERIRQEIEAGWERQRRALGERGTPDGGSPTADLLALSGGGDGGAYDTRTPREQIVR